MSESHSETRVLLYPFSTPFSIQKGTQGYKDAHDGVVEPARDLVHDGELLALATGTDMAAGRERRHAAAAMQQLDVPGVRALGTEHGVLKYAELDGSGRCSGAR